MFAACADTSSYDGYCQAPAYGHGFYSYQPFDESFTQPDNALYDGYYQAPACGHGFYSYQPFDESFTQPHNVYYPPESFPTYPQQSGYQWQPVAMPPFVGDEVVTTSYQLPASFQPSPPASFQHRLQPRNTREPRIKVPVGTTCAICNGAASGYYYGVASCLGCKTFFHRAIVSGDADRIRCRYVGTCAVTRDVRNACRKCRFNKCLLAGMALGGKRGRSSALATPPPSTGWSKVHERSMCAICSANAIGYHYDVALCIACSNATGPYRKDPVPSGKQRVHAPTTTFSEQFRYGNAVLVKFDYN